MLTRRTLAAAVPTACLGLALVATIAGCGSTQAGATSARHTAPKATTPSNGLPATPAGAVTYDGTSPTGAHIAVSLPKTIHAETVFGYVFSGTLPDFNVTATDFKEPFGQVSAFLYPDASSCPAHATTEASASGYSVGSMSYLGAGPFQTAEQISLVNPGSYRLCGYINDYGKSMPVKASKKAAALGLRGNVVFEQPITVEPLAAGAAAQNTPPAVGNGTYAASGAEVIGGAPGATATVTISKAHVASVVLSKVAAPFCGTTGRAGATAAGPLSVTLADQDGSDDHAIEGSSFAAFFKDVGTTTGATLSAGSWSADELHGTVVFTDNRSGCKGSVSFTAHRSSGPAAASSVPAAPAPASGASTTVAGPGLPALPAGSVAYTAHSATGVRLLLALPKQIQAQTSFPYLMAADFPSLPTKEQNTKLSAGTFSVSIVRGEAACAKQPSDTFHENNLDLSPTNLQQAPAGPIQTADRIVARAAGAYHVCGYANDYGATLPHDPLKNSRFVVQKSLVLDHALTIAPLPSGTPEQDAPQSLTPGSYVASGKDIIGNTSGATVTVGVGPGAITGVNLAKVVASQCRGTHKPAAPLTGSLGTQTGGDGDDYGSSDFGAFFDDTSDTTEGELLGGAWSNDEIHGTVRFTDRRSGCDAEISFTARRR